MRPDPGRGEVFRVPPGRARRPYQSGSVDIPILVRNRPPDLIRQQLGAWPLNGLTGMAAVRESLLARCHREVPLPLPAGSPVMAEVARRVELVFSELAGNAVRHGRPPISVQLACTADAWLLSVSDAAPEQELRVGRLAGDEPGGRGLALVLTMAAQAGWYVHEGRKTVWAEVPDQPPGRLLEQLRDVGSRAATGD
ncbi:ATP-binding protein [Kineosporia rhizophila]|uniref:ATP-binding protein n=1 Tax=Kineosporia TaxID=49184 RepID=UPI001E2B663B|nr:MULTISPECIES: ATP-binding protein [Kineosporia]MCE0537165.1 ATP-binding protein [Kineosporia rhizophila]GLY15987.1 hypothetical protein Kisp01_30020 [Kineosporia sp. NBRC 101677]